MKNESNSLRLMAGLFAVGLFLFPKFGLAQCNPPTVEINPQNPGFCPGGSVQLDATIESPATYLWSNGETTPMITVSLSGTYSVVVTIEVDCSATATVDVAEFSEPEISSISVFDNSGFINDDNLCSGSEVVIAANANGTAGTPPFSFQWTFSAAAGVNVSFIAQNSSFTNSTWTNSNSTPQAVILTNTMTDANGCTASLSYDVVVNSPLGLTIERDENSGTPDDGGICFGDGISFISHPTGGTGSFTNYAWTGNSDTWDTPDISDAPPYNNLNTLYFLTVTDDFGCSVATLSSAKGLTEVVLTASPNLVCTPGQNHILINTTGGQPTPSGYLGRVNQPPNVLQFFNTPPAVNYPISQPPGSTVNYHIFMKDEKGCPDSLDLEMEVPLILSANAGTDATICGGLSTQLSATATGGTGSMEFLWSPAAGLSSPTSQNPTASPTSTTIYSLVLTDEMGCTASDNLQITVLPVPEPGITPPTANLNCSTPSVVLNAATASSYLWSTNATSQSITVSQSGTYIVTLTGSNGCTSVAQAVVTGSGGSGSGSISPSTYTLTCSHTTVKLVATGGGGGGSYSWSNGSNYHEITVGVAGIYTCTITASGGCTTVATATISASYLTYYFDGDHDGYGNSALSQQNCPQWVDHQNWKLTAGDCNDNNPSIHPNANEICDSFDNDCDGQVDETTLHLTLSATQIACFGENSTLTANASGGKPNYEYKFNNGNWQNGKSKSVAAGSHVVWVRDSWGCQKMATIVITEPPLLLITAVNVVPANNNKFTVTVVASGGTPGLQYRRSKPNGWTPWQTGNVLNNVPSGNYVFQVKDSKGCIDSESAECNFGGPKNDDRSLADQFEARREPGRAHLFWVTESEPDDLFYRLERGKTAYDFELLFEKTPVGERPGAQFYAGFDEKPLAGDNFYRLLIFGKNGEARASEVKNLNFENLADHLQIWPNPTTGQLFFMPRELTGETATLVISDLLGREKMRLDFSEMPQKPVELNLSGLTNGTYFLQFKTDRSPLLTRRFVLLDE